MAEARLVSSSHELCRQLVGGWSVATGLNEQGIPSPSSLTIHGDPVIRDTRDPQTKETQKYEF